jgi:hypothetical protein
MSEANRSEFIAALNQRLDQGAAAYGERSFSREPEELLEELAQEALDLAGWGYVLWQRLQRAKQAAASLSATEQLPFCERP